jgi:hypothetical protein
MLKCPIHELPNNIVINNFYARLTLHDKGLLDASCSGSFTRMKVEAKWDLLDRIQENTEGWENDKGRKSGINYDYECIKAFMGTDDFQNVSACRCSGYRGIPVHLPLGPFNGPASAQGRNNDRSPTEKTLMRRRLMRRMTAKTAKDQKTSSRAVSREGRDHVHVSSARFHAEQEDKSRRHRTIHATLDREETSFRCACIKRHSGCWPPP